LLLEEKQFGVWLRATSKRTQKPQLIEAKRHGERRDDGDIDKIDDRMVSIPKEFTQMGKGG